MEKEVLKISKLDVLKSNVKALYTERDPKRSSWADWKAENHIHVVAENARMLAERYGANVELSQLAAWLHDVSDTKIGSSNPKHDDLSLEMAREIMQELNYSEEDIQTVVDDAIRYHSCKGEERPKTLVGQILATADAVAHLKDGLREDTGFYHFAAKDLKENGGKTPEQVKEWVGGVKLDEIMKQFRGFIHDSLLSFILSYLSAM